MIDESIVMTQNFSDDKLVKLILGRKGGKTTTKIMDELLISPKNKNNIANKLNLDYNTITYHLDLMYKYDYVKKEKFECVTLYYPSNKLYENIDEYMKLKEYLQEKLER